MKKIIIFIVVVVIVLVGVYFWMDAGSSVPAPTGAQGTQQASTASILSELNNLDEQNTSQDFSGINSDFGAEVNSATK